MDIVHKITVSLRQAEQGLAFLWTEKPQMSFYAHPVLSLTIFLRWTPQFLSTAMVTQHTSALLGVQLTAMSGTVKRSAPVHNIDR